MAWILSDLEHSLLVGSTLVEGSSLSEDQAHEVLAGRTIAGHPVAEIRELLGYRDAVAWLMRKLDASPFLSVDLLLDFHRILMQGLSDEADRLKTRRNFTYLSDGSRHDYLPPAKVEAALREWAARFNAEPGDDPVRDAAGLYLAFEQIHPFQDGNGRIGRIVLAYWLHWKAGLAWRFHASDKLAHLEALEAASRGDPEPLVSFVRSRSEPENP